MDDNSIQQKLGQVVKSFRLQIGLSQEDVAFRAGLHRTYISDVERGSRNISLKAIYSICSALEINPSELFRKIEENE